MVLQAENDRDSQKIRPLPKEVVDRIAAGEVVQRPASVVKELIENSMDANPSWIDVQCCANGGLSLIEITDDGHGINPEDLALAATRFATSKLVELDDLKTIQTFGFRGEALASTSMVSRLTITSKRRVVGSTLTNTLAYKQSYKDGQPITSNPAPSAGNFGTKVRVEDLFYNIPSRKRAFATPKKELEEYNRILAVAQRYAIHKSSDGISFTCQRRKKRGGSNIVCDLNTKTIAAIQKVREALEKNKALAVTAHENDSDFLKLQETAVRDSIRHVFGSSVAENLVQVSTQQSCQNNNAALDTDDAYEYSAKGWITQKSFVSNNSMSSFVLFINNRLVDCTSLRRAVEGVYTDILPNGAKPFVYLSLQVPGCHIDVNVHPTKREVALLYEDRICQDLADAAKDVLAGASDTKTFKVQPLTFSGKKRKLLQVKSQEETLTASDEQVDLQPNMQSPLGDHNINEVITRTSQDTKIASQMYPNAHSEVTPIRTPEHSQSKHETQSSSWRSSLSQKTKLGKKTYNPQSLVRTNLAAKAGALEPFLTPRSNTPDKECAKSTDLKKTNETVKINTFHQHRDDCEIALALSKKSSVDMAVPGAFAAICRCQVELGNFKTIVDTTSFNKPKKISPSDCSYTSVLNLRRDIDIQQDTELKAKLRQSSFVGGISRHRSLIQSGMELLLIDHYQLGVELFYQIAVMRFGQMPAAKLESHIDVESLIEQSLNIQKSLQESFCTQDFVINDNEENKETAAMATNILRSKAEMLQQYFEIDFESDGRDTLYLVGLPELIQGHCPCPDGLPAFLLRLASDVNWDSEQPCFEGICKQLANFYASAPFEDDTIKEEQSRAANLLDNVTETYVKHKLFPSIAFLLIPPKTFSTNGTVTKMALLSSLYKVFERC